MRVGVPYSEDDLAVDRMLAQAGGCDPGDLRRAIRRRRSAISTAIPKSFQMDALIAYLQMLGTLVDSAAPLEEQEKGR